MALVVAMGMCTAPCLFQASFSCFFLLTSENRWVETNKGIISGHHFGTVTSVLTLEVELHTVKGFENTISFVVQILFLGFRIFDDDCP